MSKPALVHEAEKITPDWLTEVLNFAGISGRVENLTRKSIGTGQVGENVRFDLEGEGDLPNSIVGKFASNDPVSKQTGVQLQNYIKEVFFYNELAASVDIQTPVVHYADIIDETHDFAIIMEDLAPGEQGDQLNGCSVDDAALAQIRANSLELIERGGFGTPSMLVDNTLFFGNDRIALVEWTLGPLGDEEFVVPGQHKG